MSDYVLAFSILAFIVDAAHFSPCESSARVTLFVFKAHASSFLAGLAHGRVHV